MVEVNEIRIRLTPEILVGGLDELRLPLGVSNRVVLVRPQATVLTLGGLSFATDREVLLPDVEALHPSEPGPVRVPAIDVLARLFRAAAEHPEHRLLIAGHADSVGSDAANAALSQERGENVAAYIRGDFEAWGAHCHEHFEVEDAQVVLRWVSREFSSFDCDPGAVDGDEGPQTRAARDRFRAQCAPRYGATPPSGSLSAPDWAVFATLYDDAVAARLGVPSLDESRAGVRLTNPAVLGFSERYPTDQPGVDKLDSERNRRVEFVFLQREEAESLSGLDEAGELLYGASSPLRKVRIETGFETAADEIGFRFLDPQGRRVHGVSYSFRGDDGAVHEGVVEPSGELKLSGLVRGRGVLQLFGVDAVDWESIPAGPRELPPPPQQRQDPDADPDIDPPIDEFALATVFDDDEPGDDEPDAPAATDDDLWDVLG